MKITEKPLRTLFGPGQVTAIRDLLQKSLYS